MSEYKTVKDFTLDLVKASYVDDVLSLRYKNDISNMIDSLYLVSDFTDDLTNQGFKQTYKDENKMIYSNKDYKIIVKNNLDYLIILIMEI